MSAVEQSPIPPGDEEEEDEEEGTEDEGDQEGSDDEPLQSEAAAPRRNRGGRPRGSLLRVSRMEFDKMKRQLDFIELGICFACAADGNAREIGALWTNRPDLFERFRKEIRTRILGPDLA